MQSKTHILPIAGIGGFIGVIVMSFNFWIGLLIFLASIAPLIAKMTIKERDVPTIPPANTIFSEFEITEAPNYAKPLPTPRSSRQTYQPLLAKIATSGRNVNVPVVNTDAEPLTARDIITEIAQIAEAHNEKPEELVGMICDMYDLFWDYAEEATNDHKFDTLEQIRLYIATSAYFKFHLPEVK